MFTRNTARTLTSAAFFAGVVSLTLNAHATELDTDAQSDTAAGSYAHLDLGDAFAFETSLRFDGLAAGASAHDHVKSGRELLPRKTTREDKRYSEREQASAEAQNYRGGDTLIIGATTATIILAVILLVVLL